MIARGITFKVDNERRRRRYFWCGPPTILLIGILTMSFSSPSLESNAVYGFSVIPIVQNQRLKQQEISDTLNRRQRAIPPSPSSRRTFQTTSLLMSTSDFDDTTNDPFIILGLDTPTADQKVIKRAYKRRALQYHPDVVSTSTKEGKKAASDRFAKINWAYETLSGKRDASDKTYGGSSRTSTSAGTDGGGWTPPHRRSGGYSDASSSSSSSSTNWPGTTDWRDFMPKYQEDGEYDTAGDSFGKIFSDLFAGAAVGAAGAVGTSANLFLDFIEFLEGNVDGYGSSSGGGFGSAGSDDYDADLQVLLRTGSLDDVANEMDDTNLVVQQLQAKATSIDDEILTTNAEAKMTSRYMDKVQLEERVAELKARKVVVDGYLKKAQKRLLSLQTRYKELISGGANDSYAGGGSSSRSRTTASSTQPPPPSGQSSDYRSRSSYSTSSSSSSRGGPSSTKDDKGEEDSWMNEGFGSSSGRGNRGSARRRASRRTATSARASTDAGVGKANRSSSSYSDANPYPPPPPSSTPRREPTYSSSSSFRTESVRPPSSPPSGTQQRQQQQARPPPSISGSDVPPHRRTSSYESSAEENKRRMREIKVDEEFEKLKKELGL
jgi:hypothetical protein